MNERGGIDLVPPPRTFNKIKSYNTTKEHLHMKEIHDNAYVYCGMEGLISLNCSVFRNMKETSLSGEEISFIKPFNNIKADTQIFSQ